MTGLVVPAELETAAQIFFEQSGSGLDRGYAPLRSSVPAASESRAGTRRRPARQSLYEMGELGLGSNMAFRIAVLRAAGGFDEALGTGTPTRGGEDLAILVELLAGGHRLAYEPAAIVHHTHRATIADLERQIHGYGVGFTAMLTAIALRDPRHLPAWPRSFRVAALAARSRFGQARKPPSDFPTAWAELSCAGCSRGRSVPARAPDAEAVGSSELPAPAMRRPIKLATIDLESFPEAIDGGPGYGALWALVREHDRPRGMIRVPFDGGIVSRGQLAVAIAALPAPSHAPRSPAREHPFHPSRSWFRACSNARKASTPA